MQTILTEFVIFFLIVLFLAYLIPAGLFHLIFFRNGIAGIDAGRIQQRKPTMQTVRHEVKHSLMSVVLFAVYSTLIYQAIKAGYTSVYFQWSDYPWWMPPLGILLAIILHDTYFYWTHRFCHWAPVFPYIHAGHHKSLAPTPWAILSFQPIETIFQFGIFALLIFFVPMHPVIFLGYLFYDSIVNAAGHSGHEFLPKHQKDHWLLKYTTVVTHHDLHHSKFNCNYGQYFTLWDRWFGTFRDRD